MIALAVGVTVVVIAGAGLAAVKLMGGSQGGTEAGGAVRATSTPAGSFPAASATSGNGAADQVARLTMSLRAAGYACFESVTQPVLIHSCYLDPGTILDKQIVRIQSVDRKITSINLGISYFRDDKTALRLFTKTVKALAPAFLAAGEAAEIVQRRSPGKHVRKTLSGGMSDLFVSDKGGYYILDLVARGAATKTIPYTGTQVTVAALRDRFVGKGFNCAIQAIATSMKCRRKTADAVYTALIFDPCLQYKKKYESICKGHRAYSVSANVGFADGLKRAQYESLFTFLIETAEFSMGGWNDQTRNWVLAHMGGGKVHRADFQGMHLDLVPGYGVHEQFPNVFSLDVRGINLSVA